MYPRKFNYTKSLGFFLFGPRGTGKSTWLKSEFCDATYIDLLDQAVYQEYIFNPELFKLKLNTLPNNSWVIIDEIQRAPDLLNYVQKYITEKKIRFVLTGSSSRKLKHTHANMLGGRVALRKFSPLTASELGNDFDIKKSLLYGHLPLVCTSEDPKTILKSYLGSYLREEVQQEALVRNITLFSKFLETASYSQAQVLSVQSVASDIGIDRKTAEAYFQIMEDLLIADRIPVFTKKAKRKMTVKPKFFIFDVGIYRTLRPRGPLDSTEEIEGPAIETLVYQEIKAWIENNDKNLKIYFYRTQDKQEVDFILYGDDGFFAIEVKRNSRLRSEDFKSINNFVEDYPQAKSFIIYGGNETLQTDTKIKIVPISKFLLEIDKYLSL